MKPKDLLSAILFVALLPASAPAATGVAVVLKATGTWHLDKDTTPVRAGQELPAQSTVFSNPSDGAGAILIKVYGRPKPDPYSAPASIPLPDPGAGQPDLFEQFIKLYHRLFDPPRVDLRTTLASTTPAPSPGSALFVGMDPVSREPSGELYLVRRYHTTGMALGQTDRPDSWRIDDGTAVALWNNDAQFRLQPQKVTPGEMSAFRKNYQIKLGSLGSVFASWSLGPDRMLTAESGQVDLSEVLSGLLPNTPVSLAPIEKGGEESALKIVLSWSTPTPAYKAPLAPGLYRLSHYDPGLQSPVGRDSLVLVLAPAARSSADLLFNNFNQRLDSWGAVLDPETRRTMVRSFFHYLSESGVN